jgi:beta-glucanase (GH16 family)
MIHVHIWKSGKKVFSDQKYVKVEPGSLTADFHTYGVDISEDWTVFYLDRREVWRTRSQPEFLNPTTYILIDLAAGGGWPIEGMKDPSIMNIDYVRAYKRR